MNTFSNSVLKITHQIPFGKVSSYGRIAQLAGLRRGGILVGRILHNTIINYDNIIPWWRVVNKDGVISTTCLEHPATYQASLLKKERIKVINEKGVLKVDIKKYLWIPYF